MSLETVAPVNNPAKRLSVFASQRVLVLAISNRSEMDRYNCRRVDGRTERLWCKKDKRPIATASRTDKVPAAIEYCVRKWLGLAHRTSNSICRAKYATTVICVFHENRHSPVVDQILTNFTTCSVLRRTLFEER
jgi:hypothetical protein